MKPFCGFMIVFFLIATSFSALADNHVDYTNKEQVNNLEPADLALAIEQGNVPDMSVVDDGKLAQALGQNPSITYKLGDEDLARALRADVSLIQDINPLNPVFVDLTFRAIKNPSILNNNAQVKKVWFSRFQIEDQGVVIQTFDGKQIMTGGDHSGTYTILDFPGAKALADGSLVFEGKTFSRTKELHRVVKDGVSSIVMVSGVLETKTKDFEGKETSVQVSQGGDIKITDSDGSIITYSGDFSLDSTKQGIEITSAPGRGSVLREVEDFEQRYSNMQITGRILQPKGSHYGEFVFIGSGSILSDTHEAEAIKISMPPGARTYYTEMSQRDAGKFCGEGACIVNTPKNDFDSLYRARLLISGVPAEGAVEVSSIAYYSGVEFERIEGDVSFVSLDDQGKEKSSVIVHNNGIAVKGTLDKTNAGRVDLVKKDTTCGSPTCPEILYHWSSDQFQKDDARRYFEKPNTQFVSCTRGVDCLERIAGNFGTLVGPAGKPITTVVIIGGDNANVAQSLENGHCKQTRCAIINSRDVPPELGQSVNTIVVTGHHNPEQDSIWRDTAESTTGHNAIDRLYFNRVEGGSVYDNLPDAKDVKSITFSSCNSVTVDKGRHTMYDGAILLLDRYKRVRFVNGWNGKAPYEDAIRKIIDSPEVVATQARESHNREGLAGERASYYCQDDMWYMWNGVDQPISLLKRKCPG